MPNTFTQVYIHIVFAVKDREKLISDSWKKELFSYITGIIHRQGQRLLIINGVKDHVHLLISLRADVSISNLVRDIKSNSSRFIKEKEFLLNFNWQIGFGAFSVSHSAITKVYNYIKNQEYHHQKISFQDEFVAFLQKNNIELQTQYLP
jgi:putative transposase